MPAQRNLPDRAQLGLRLERRRHDRQQRPVDHHRPGAAGAQRQRRIDKYQRTDDSGARIPATSTRPSSSIGGGGGSGATAVAIVSGGQVTGIQITNPGTGYTSSPTFMLLGGGGSATVGGSAGLAANVGGGLTFAGAGMTTLSGSNTYTGGTTINGGLLVFSIPVPFRLPEP